MKILYTDLKNNYVKILINSQGDLQKLSYFIEPGDVIFTKSFRKFSGESFSERKEVYIYLKVDEVKYREETSTLRIFGRIVGGKPEEYIALNKHHSIDAEVGQEIEITKPKLYNFQLYLLKEWEKETQKPSFMIVAIDEEKASLAIVYPYGLGKINEIKSKLSKRLEEKEYAQKEQEYLEKIQKAIKESKVKVLILCGPGFEKEKLAKMLSGIEVHIFQSTSSEVSAIYEVLKSKEFEELVAKFELQQEDYLMEKLITSISKQGNYAIGFENVKNAVLSGRVSTLLVTSEVLKKEEAKELIEQFKKKGGSLRILNASNPAGQQLSSLGGIAALFAE